MAAKTAYRWLVFLLAGGYLVYMILVRGDYSQGFGPFRFLTVWALILSFFSASRMMALMEGRSTSDWPVLVALAATANAMVVYLYWSLYFNDPASVQGRGPIAWWLEYYVHLVGPILQWIDALFLHRRVRRLPVALMAAAALVIAYVLFLEYVLRPLNDEPFGSVTDGLPYPFLNNLELSDRIAFYGQTLAGALVVMVAFFGLAALIRRLIDGTWRSTRIDSRDI